MAVAPRRDPSSTPGSIGDGRSDEAPSAAAGVAPEEDIARAGRWPLLFVAGALLALAILPILQERRIAEIERHVEQTLEPAGRLGDELVLLQARQMARFQAYLLTGEPSLRLRHRELADREREVQRELRALAGRSDLDIGEPLARLTTASMEWHLGHQVALGADSLRERYVAAAADEQARYDSVLAAARFLDETVSSRLEEGRRRMDQARAFQVWLIVGLALLALVATAALVVIGRRLRELVRQAEERRREALKARREMQAVLEASGDGVVGIDLEGRCRTLNRTASELLGYKELEVQGWDIHQLLHGRAPGGEPHPPDGCPLLAALRTGVTEQRTDDVVWRRDGKAFPSTWHLRPLLDGRVVRGAVVTITDMTEIREVEKALRRAVRAREEVVAMVSHDLRNPLGTVIAAVALLRELDLPPDERRAQLVVIRRAAENMRRMIEDLLDVARIEGGGLTVDPRPTALAPLVEDALELVAAAAEERGVRLENAVPDGLPPVLADDDRIIQVLSNLLGNAVKFTDAGRRVRIAASQTADGGGVEVEVSDEGRGIDPDHLEHLFDRFWQLEKGDRQGAGLGLTIVRGIVLAHGGTIEVESQPGRGSTFRFVLLRARAVPERELPAPRRAVAARDSRS